jgi:hypothetical protein
LIVTHPKLDVVGTTVIQMIRDHQIEGVSYRESLGDKQHRAGLLPDSSLEFDFHLIEVPAGEEIWKIDYLQFFYKAELFKAAEHGSITAHQRGILMDSYYPFSVVPNGRLATVSSSPGPVPTTHSVDANDFAFSAEHATYKQMIRP